MYLEIFKIMLNFSAGLMTTVVPMYLNEISPPSFTGLMGVLFPSGLTFGILISQIMGLNILLGQYQVFWFSTTSNVISEV